jgi:uncharacterized damage-inducible protein DinB
LQTTQNRRYSISSIISQNRKTVHMITKLEDFIAYFEGIRRRTLNYIRVIPPDRLDWQPKEGEFNCADIIRHLTATEQMYVHLIIHSRWLYPGHEGTEAETLESLIAKMGEQHQAAMDALRQLTNDVLQEGRPSFVPDAPPVKGWRWLMVMVEHEVHHRSQLASYLTLMGVEPPQIYGVGVEELIARATG